MCRSKSRFQDEQLQEAWLVREKGLAGGASRFTEDLVVTKPVPVQIH